MPGGSSKAGRSWCQGASELRGADAGVLPDDGPALSGRSAAGSAHWLAEPCDALRARRGVAGDG
ncbi:hypothetical protein GTX07_16510 [Streptomyces sp. SID5606]|nr:hypothetical protein [Streptomyces sp. SID5606]